MWNMPKSVLRIVALILAACAATGFIMGVRGAPEQAPLPEEEAPAAPARQFQPLNTDPPPPPAPPEKTEEEKKAEAEKAAADKAAAEKAAADKAQAPAPADRPPSPPSTPAPPSPPTSSNDDTVGDLIDGLTPPADQPPF
jgi:membrane protein involved in colicin uptake